MGLGLPSGLWAYWLEAGSERILQCWVDGKIRLVDKEYPLKTHYSIVLSEP